MNEHTKDVSLAAIAAVAVVILMGLVSSCEKRVEKISSDERIACEKITQDPVACRVSSRGAQ